MSYELGAECPCCEVTAGRDFNEIDKIFGFRNIHGKKIPQSYCRNCRTLKCSLESKKCNIEQ